MQQKFPSCLATSGLALSLLSASASAQTLYDVVSVLSHTSAEEAAAAAKVKIQRYAAAGWTAINVTSADIYPFVLDRVATPDDSAAGGKIYVVNGTKEWDVYVLMSCIRQPPRQMCVPPP